MLLVKTRVDKSDIHGLGLFADEDIPKGTLMWRFEPGFDSAWSQDEYQTLLQSLPESAREFLKYYSFKSDQTDRQILDGDNDKYTNHSDEPNEVPGGELHNGEPVWIAARDIKKGEEITNDYGNFTYRMK